MSSTSEQLVRDVAAVTRGVVVSEAALREARDAVHERIERRRRRDRARTVAAAAAAAVVLVGVGTAFVSLDRDDALTQVPGSGPVLDPLDADHLTGSAPTARAVEGVWRLDNGETTVEFDQRGTVRFDDRGTLFSDPATTGTYEVADGLVTVTTTHDREAGCTGTRFTMRASFPEPGEMRFIGSDTAGTCAPLPPGERALQKVLPTSRSMAELVFSQDTGWQPLSREATLHGVWLAEGGGHLLELAPGGSYYVAGDAGSPVDTGRWSLRGADLTLTSSARSTTCREGDQLVLAGVDWIDPGTRALRGTVERNACGGAWTPAAWILIPNSGS